MADRSNNPTKIIVHHDGVSREGPSFAIIDDFHKGREFPISSLGFYVGYHYWIERDGSVIQARKETDEGAHTKGQNFSSVGIGLAGNFDVEDPTEAQIAALGVLLSRVVRRYGIAPTAIQPHRRYAEKSCYGARLNDNWAALVYLHYEVARLTEILRMVESSQK